MTVSRKLAWCIWLLVSMFYAFQYILRVMPNIMMDDIIAQFHINAKTFGQFSGVYYIGYSLMHLPLGIMLDRFGPKKILPICILMTVIGILPIIFSEFWVYPLIGRVLLGMGSSGAILGAFKIISSTFAAKKFTRMLSFSVTIGLIGGIYGGGPVNYLCELFGYKTVVGIFAVTGILLAIFSFLLIPEIEKKRSSSVVSDVKSVLTNPKVLLICFFAGLMVGPLEGFADVWASGFLKQVYGFEYTLAASIPSAIFVGMCFGSPVLTFIGDKSKSYFGTIIVSGIIMALVFLALVLTRIPASILSVSFVCVGVCSAYQILAIYKASTYVKPEVIGLTTAIANMIIMFFGYFFHSIIGAIIHSTGGPSSSIAFTNGIIVIPVCLIIGFLGFIGIALQERSSKKRRV